MTTNIYLPSVPGIATIFEEECTALGASSVDSIQDETQLFARAVCGPCELVCVGDEVRAGVALRVDGPNVFVHPYTLRQVCVNGFIAPLVVSTSRLERIATEETVAAATFTGGFTTDLRHAIRTCAGQDLVAKAARDMADLSGLEEAATISMLMHLMHARGVPHETLLLVLKHHATSGDQSAFGLVNAVTAVARETRHAPLRWDLECIGGELVARSASMTRANRRRSEVLVTA